VTSPASKFVRPRIAVLGVVALALTLAIGVFVGLRAPWGTKHPQVEQGVAMRANGENDLVMFDAEDGTQLTLYASGVWWESESAGGEGDPPCLRKPGKKADVEVGFMWVAGPNGGARQVPQWVRCL
jgi:hypothetical protein